MVYQKHLTGIQNSIELKTDLATTRTIVVNMLVVGEAAYLLNCRHILRPVWSKEAFFGNKTVWPGIGLIALLQLLITYVPFMQHFFGTAAIGWHHWLHILVFGVVIFLIVELEKWVARSCLLRRHRIKN